MRWLHHVSQLENDLFKTLAGTPSSLEGRCHGIGVKVHSKPATVRLDSQVELGHGEVPANSAWTNQILLQRLAKHPMHSLE